jgi:hypothetical protein
MTDRPQLVLADEVRISRLYQRSIRIDADLGRPEALDGYICHATARALLEGMSRQVTESGQRAFTWTGPFGGGKSSLALALASALAADKTVRAKGRSVLHLSELPSFDKAFPCKKGWLTLPVVGKRAGVVEEIAKALRKARGGRGEPKRIDPGALIDEICEMAQSREFDGVLVLIDEMGKFLEASALGVGDDVNFYQDLAELGSRTEGRVVIVGILHQAFAQYAKRLGNEARDSWAKVQGRYADIPLVAASDEVVELIGRAIECKKDTEPAAGGADRRFDPRAPSCRRPPFRGESGGLLASASDHGLVARADFQAAIWPKRTQRVRVPRLSRTFWLPLVFAGDAVARAQVVSAG